jgi:AraC-like DNA-binding protein/Tfp pilus assembly protein PilF
LACSGQDGPTHASAANYDSLIRAVKQSGNQIKLADLYLKMANDHESGIHDTTGDSLVLLALKIYTDADSSRMRIQCYNHLLITAFNQGDNFKARDYAGKALDIAQKKNLEKEVALAYSNLSVIYARLGDYEKANDYNFLALRIFKKMNDRVQIARCNLSIGTVYIRLKDFTKAMDYITNARDAFLKFNDQKGYSICVSNIGSIYMELKDFRKALPCFYEAVEIDEKNKDLAGTSSNFSNIGIVYFNLGNNTGAMEYYTKALEIDRSTGDKSGIANLFLNISRLLLVENKTDSALSYCTSAIRYFNETGEQTEKQQALEHLAAIHEKSGNSYKALAIFKKAAALKDSLFNTEKSAKIAMLEEKYINEKLVNENLLLNYRNDLQKTRISGQRKLNITYIIALFAAIIAIVIIVIQLREKNIAYKFIVKKNIDLIKKERELGSVKNELKTIMSDEKAKSSFSDDDKEKLLSKLEKLLNQDKIYIRTDLTVEKLARRLSTNRTYLSQIINEIYNKSYSDLINEYRVNEAMALLADPVIGNKYSIEAIAKEAGFNTISNFNMVFKKHVGITPSIFRKNADYKEDTSITLPQNTPISQ